MGNGWAVEGFEPFAAHSPAASVAARNTARAVSEANVEIVRSIYRAWADGRSARDLIDTEIEYVNPPDAVESGTRRGPDAFRGIRDAYEDVKIEPSEFIEAGDDVVVIARVTGKGRGSGFPIDWLHGYIWTIHRGKAIRFRWFNKPDEALEAAGLSGH